MPTQTLTPEDLEPLIEELKNLRITVQCMKQRGWQEASVPEYCTARQVKELIIPKCVKTLNDWADMGYIKRIKRGGSTLYSRDSIRKFLTSKALRKAV